MKKRKEKKGRKELLVILFSAIPALLLFLLLFIGLHWNIFLSMGLSAAAYLALTLVLKPEEHIGKLEVSSLQNGEFLRDRLGEALEDFERIEQAVLQIHDMELRKQCEKLREVGRKILIEPSRCATACQGCGAVFLLQ